MLDTFVLGQTVTNPHPNQGHLPCEVVMSLLEPVVSKYRRKNRALVCNHRGTEREFTRDGCMIRHLFQTQSLWATLTRHRDIHKRDLPWGAST